MQKNTLYGITHDADSKLPIIREPRVLKVGIGIPKGRAVQVFKYQGEWHIRLGVWEKNGDKNKFVMRTMFRGPSREEAEKFYRANKDTAAVSNRPQELKYFTFGRRRIAEESGKPIEVIEPDWDAIEAHGEVPTEIEVLLMTDEPLAIEMAMWSASEKKCHGDGIDAMRVISMGGPEMPGWKEAKEAGEKYFPISKCVKGCCPYASEQVVGGKVVPAACKPNGNLVFQLGRSMRLGASSYFTTTGRVSVAQMFSAIEIFREWRSQIGTGLRGLTLIMKLGSFKANHNGIAAIKPSVSLEIHPRDMATLVTKLQQVSWEKSAGQSARMIESAEVVEAETLDNTAAGTMSAEFYDAEVVDEDEPEVTGEAATAKAETEKKTAALAEKVKRVKTEPVVKAEPALEPMKPIAFAGGQPKVDPVVAAAAVAEPMDTSFEFLGDSFFPPASNN